jgi:hypothetical protein
MKNVLDEINILPGVIGSCLFNHKYGVLCPGLPSSFTKDTIENIFNRIKRLYEMGDTLAMMEIQTFTFWFDAFILTATFVEKTTLLITVCQLWTNLSLVSTTITVMTKELKEELAKECSTEQRYLTFLKNKMMEQSGSITEQRYLTFLKDRLA